MKKIVNTLFAFASLNYLPISQAVEYEYLGSIGAQARYFTQETQDPEQTEQQFSLYAEPEVYFQWNDGNDSLTFKPFARLDSADDERTHFDIRELFWLHVQDDWELRVGINKVFWGVTETLHLVDIVNQTDAIEAFDGEEKLGQPMVQFSMYKDWGYLDLFILPYFRERTYAGREGRLRGPFLIDTDNPVYESDKEERHIDFAANWRNSYDFLDVSLNVFKGTSREPNFIPKLVNGVPTGEIVPFYPQITQFGAVMQYVSEAWLWKMEAINRTGDLIDDFNALVGGFEYTMVGINDSSTDLGWVVEYAYDERDASQVATQNDLSVAARIALNDIDSTEVLIGLSHDLEFTDSRAMFIEANTRVGKSSKLILDMWLFNGDDPQDISSQFKNEDFIQVSYEWYF
ncbi:hypothetical protein N7931_07185 [Catenovulum sp. 2E275]|uniref:hypothetical protein n=1 Tax=Catenovulum sp. 2E275 TaxID=2980497 RepID=UPI0021D26D5A|nr:hypothetical protein [Catenovulum sp. 2E275]MCU4675415.1 hypothetical protein [Catenovulum sp. 2E275]